MASISKTVRPKRSNNPTVSPAGMGLTVGRGTPTTATVGAGSEPTPSGTVFLDTRAGGNYDMQVMTSVADFEAIPGMSQFSDNPAGGFAFTTNYDGNGKRALRFDWPQSTVETVRAWLYYTPATYSNLYMSVVVHLGRTSTGGGIGTVGAFSAGTHSLGAATKRAFFYRVVDNDVDRLMWVWPWGPPASSTAQHLEVVGGPTSTWTADYGEGVDVRWTWELLPGTTSVVRQWRNGVLVLSNTNAGLGTRGFAEVQFPSNRQHTGQDESEYWTDLVMWTV